MRRASLPYTRPAAFVSFNPSKQRPGERFFFRPPVVSTQSHSNRRRGHVHVHVPFLFRRPARESHVYLDIRRALVPSNDRGKREVLAAGLGGDQRAAAQRARGRVERDGTRRRRRHYLRVITSIPLEIEALVRWVDEKIDISFFLLLRVFFVRFFFPIRHLTHPSLLLMLKITLLSRTN